jgi:hypothetical protein
MCFVRHPNTSPEGLSVAHALVAPPDVGEAISDREARVGELDSSAPSYGSLLRLPSSGAELTLDPGR